MRDALTLFLCGLGLLTLPACSRSPAQLPGHSSPIRALAFAPSGPTLASGDEAGTLKLWNPATRTEITSAADPQGQPVGGLYFAPDGASLALLRVQPNPKEFITLLELWQVNPPRRRQTFDVCAHALCFTPDGQNLLIGERTGTVQLWSIAQARVLHEWPLERGVLSIAIFQDTAVVGTRPDPMERIVARGVTQAQAMALAVPNHSSVNRDAPGSYSVHLQPYDTFLAILDLKNPDAPIQKIPGNDNGTTALRFSADGKTLFAGGWDSSILQISTAAWKIERTVTLPFEFQTVLLAPASDRYIFYRTYSTIGDRFRFSLSSGDLRSAGPRHFHTGEHSLSAIALAPDGQTLATAQRVFEPQPSYPILLWDKP